jgi:CheY-like chemotaxis protein
MKPEDCILLAEDSKEDVVIFRYAYQEAGLPNPLQIVKDGAEAVEYLEGKGGYSDRARFPFPRLLLLDLRMPKIPGLEVLKFVRKHPEWSDLPVVILSTSDQASDIEGARLNGATGYVTKPSHPDELTRFLHSLRDENFQMWNLPSWIQGHLR